MNHWFRFYDATLDDPKVQRLSDKLYRAWTQVLCISCRYEGKLPRLSDMAFLMRRTEKETKAILIALREAELVDGSFNDGSATPHNWQSRQFHSDVSTDRVKRFRKRKRNVSPDVSETPPDTDTDTEVPITNVIGPKSADAELFEKGKNLLGRSSGGLIRELVQAKGGSIPLSRAALEVASTKENPREYIGGVVRSAGSTGPPGKPNLLEIARNLERQAG